METQQNKPIDWSGRKYLVAKELGENIDMFFGKKNGVQTNETNWFVRCHSESDGVGAFTDLLKQFSETEMAQPFHQKVPKPFWIKRILRLIQYVWSTRPIAFKWKYSDTSKTDFQPVCTSWLSTSDTNNLLRWSKENRISINSLWLWALDKVITTTYLSEPHERAWLIPVNMRGGVRVLNPSANYTASLNLRFSGLPELVALDQQIKKQYQMGQAWGSWIYSHISRFVSHKTLKNLAKSYKSCWLGVFSNLGAWPIVDDQLELLSDSAWTGAAPVTKLNPFGAVVMTWQGRMSISLRIHACIQQTPDDAKDIMTALMKLLVEKTQINLIPNLELNSWESINLNSIRF